MDFGLSVTSNLEQEKTSLISKISDELELAFKNKNYGNDVKSYTIGVVCVTSEFEQFIKIKKPRYTKGKKQINPDGIPFTLEDNFEYSIKIDFETFKNGTAAECQKLLAKEIVNSLNVFDDLKEKIKDFNVIKFKSDLEKYFKARELI